MGLRLQPVRPGPAQVLRQRAGVRGRFHEEVHRHYSVHHRRQHRFRKPDRCSPLLQAREQNDRERCSYGCFWLRGVGQCHRCKYLVFLIAIFFFYHKLTIFRNTATQRAPKASVSEVWTPKAALSSVVQSSSSRSGTATATS